MPPTAPPGPNVIAPVPLEIKVTLLDAKEEDPNVNPPIAPLVDVTLLVIQDFRLRQPSRRLCRHYS
jgi:hypothetical protein